jgi:hypothetical protein
VKLSRTLPIAGLVLCFTAAPAPALAHGIGGRADLPVPVSYFAVGAGLVIVMTFVMLSSMWTEPRLQAPPSGRGRTSPATRIAARTLQVIGITALAVVLFAGFGDGTASALNVTPALVFVAFWLVVPFVGVIIGNWWRWINPWATLSTLINGRRPEREDWVARFGVWGAAATFVAFTWLELVAPSNSDPTFLATAALVYTIAVLVVGFVAGPRSGLRLFEAFHTYNELAAAIAPIDLVGADAAGTTPSDAEADVVHRGWLRALPSLPQWPGQTAFVVAMIGTVSYDGLSSTEWWASTFADVRRETWFETLALLAGVAVIGAAYWLATFSAARLAGGAWTTQRVAVRFAHTLVPIGVAYAVAHYFTLVLFEGQLLLIAASDPMGRGWDLFGTADWSIQFFMSPEVVWYVQLLAIIAGHVAGVVLAHDRALADYGGPVAVRTQYAMLALMVALTSLALFVLAG